METDGGAYTTGLVPSTLQKRMAHSLMQERMTMPRRTPTMLEDEHDSNDYENIVDIPAEVAYIFSKIHDWTPPHNDSDVIYAVGHVEAIEHAYHLPEDINTHDFSKFVNIYFSTEENFYRRKKPIEHPLLPKKSLYEAKESIALFKLILKYMNDPKLNSKQATLLGDYIVQKGLTHDELRDEVLCQLCMQTYQHPEPDIAERGWTLMANCLCCFEPSDALAPYLVKYVSDQAPDHFKAYLQHKALQCLHRPLQPMRVYPPCLLEWKANHKATLMALEANFLDNTQIKGHVESFTTGEQFARHLLKCRDVSEESSGWHVVLRDSAGVYECAGYDYVLDIISEIEVPPSFPFGKSHIVVHPQNERSLFKGMAHEASRPRLMELEVDELRHPIPMAHYNTLPTKTLLKDTSHPVTSDKNEWFSTEDEMLAASKLNTRKAVPKDGALSSRSALNVRYTQAGRQPITDSDMNGDLPTGRHSAPLTQRYSSSPSTPDTVNGISPVFSSSFDDPPAIPNGVTNGDIAMSAKSRMNNRYMRGSPVPEGVSSSSKLNRRYHKNNSGKANGQVQQRAQTPIRYEKNPKQGNQARRRISQNSRQSRDSYAESGSVNTDMDQWLNNVFDPVLDDLKADGNASEAASLAGRIKGGGKSSQTNNSLVINNELDQSTKQWVNNIISKCDNNQEIEEINSESLVSRLKGGGTTQAQLQVPATNQFQMAPTANQFFPAVGQAAGNVQTYIDPMSPTLRYSDPQQAELQRQLQTKQLETQILEQSLQAEVLRKQIQQISSQPRAAPIVTPVAGPTVITIPDPRSSVLSNSTLSPPAQVYQAPPPVAVKPIHIPPQPIAPISPTAVSPNAAYTPPKRAQGEIDETRPGGVKTLGRLFEHRAHPAVTQNHYEQPPRLKPPPKHEEGYSKLPSRASTVTFSDDVAHIPRDENFSPSPRASGPSDTSSVPSESPPPIPSSKIPSPPPPMPSTDKSQESGARPKKAAMAVTETFDKKTIVDRKGDIKRVRVGKVEWPPRKEEDAPKPKEDVGRLLIEEKSTKEPPKIKGTPIVMDSSIKTDFAKAEKEIEVLRPKKQKEESKGYDDIDMTARKKALQEQLASIHMKKDPPADEPPKKTWKDIGSQSEAGYTPDSHKHLDSSVSEFETVSQMGSTRTVLTQTTGEPSPITREEPSAFSPYIRPSTPEPTTTTTSPKPPSTPVSPVVASPQRIVSPEPIVDLRGLENITTQLYEQLVGPFYIYDTMPWRLQVRKEVFTPTETLEEPLLVGLVFAQIIQDVFDDSCMRIELDDKMTTRRELEQSGINPETAFSHKHSKQTKEKLISTAKTWPYYFSRFYPVHGGVGHPAANFAAVSHRGIVILRRDYSPDGFPILAEHSFEEMHSVCTAKDGVVQVNLKAAEPVLLYTSLFEQLRENIESYLIEQSGIPVIRVKAIKDYHTEEKDHLNFAYGDIIILDHRDRNLPEKWMYGTSYGRCGRFPAEYVAEIQKRAPISRASSIQHRTPYHVQPAPPVRSRPESNHDTSIRSSVLSRDLPPDDISKYILLEYAILNFKESPFRVFESHTSANYTELKRKALHDARRRRQGAGEWGRERQYNMVRWQKERPITSLLKYDDPRITNLAMSIDRGIMQLMCDLEFEGDKNHTDSMLHIINNMRLYPQLKDEAFCFIMKQTTDNPNKTSESHGLRTLSMLLAYHFPSESLGPLVDNFLAQNMTDSSITADCMRNLEVTIQKGGRKNVPGAEEILATWQGRRSKKIPCMLVGGASIGVEVNIVKDVEGCINDICDEMEIWNPIERLEYVMFYVMTAEEHKSNRHGPMPREEYILDITTQLETNAITYYVLFQRTSWNFPLHLGGSELYVDMMYNIVVDGYLQGHFFILGPNMQDFLKDDVCRLAALKMRVDKYGLNPVSGQHVEDILPETLINSNGMNSAKWLKLVHDQYTADEVEQKSIKDCKVDFLTILARSPHFGSTFFNAKRVSGPDVNCHESKVAVSKFGIKILRLKSNAVVANFPMSELLSAKRETNAKGKVCIKLTHGKPNKKNTTKIETNQATAINSLISQYVSIKKKML